MHLALTGRHVEIAACLVNVNQCASFLASKVGISPLYLAVEAGNVPLVVSKLRTTSNEGRKTNFDFVHVALKAKSRNPSLGDE
ncbi:unnamed protein product [Arabidopsis thaliana]|uniref:(thale cress) hypothetical protein n=1 Tax=Arabidopsis thaliana TaxID=3702 RepID=A0A7G2EUR0_ARATH|nr:unnamed protein product [Arabidopsis thaliana]